MKCLIDKFILKLLFYVLRISFFEITKLLRGATQLNNERFFCENKMFQFYGKYGTNNEYQNHLLMR